MLKKLPKKWKCFLASLTAFTLVFASIPVNAMETEKEDFNKNEVVNQKETVNDEVEIKGEDGFKISAPATPERVEIFPKLKLEVKAPANEAELEENVLNAFDPNATAKAYELHIENLEQTEGNGNLFEPNVNVTMPIPKGWDTSRTIAVEIDQYGYGTVGSQVDLQTNTLSFKTTLFAQKNTNQYVLLQLSIPTQVKDWDMVVDDYVHYLRSVNWGTGIYPSDMKPHFFESTALANDIALITLRKNTMLKYTVNSKYYDETKGILQIPYDEFVQDAKKLFVNLPDMTKVDVAYSLSYDAKTNMFVTEAGGIGDAPLVTVVDGVQEVNENTYAIWFKVSHDTIEEQPDMSDPSAYTKCTLTLQDNGEGEWKYLSFEEGYVNKVPEEKPENPDKPELPGKPDQPTESENTLTDEEISQIVSEIKNTSKNGENIKISMGNANILPSDILLAAKGKNVNVILEMNGYAWTINGEDILSSDVKDINMEVKENTGVIPKEAIDQLAKGKDIKQISLAHDGEFGFKAQLTLNMGKQYAGKYGNMFWYQKDKTFKHIASETIDNKGNITFTMEHASDYVIVLDDKKMSDNTITDVKKPIEDSPKTGVSVPVFAYMVMFAFASIVLIKQCKKVKE